MSVRIRAAVIALIFVAPAIGAQTTPSPILQRLTALDAKKIEAVERGEAVTVTIDAPDKTEVAMLGVVKLDVPRAFYLEHVRELTGFLASGMRTSAGTINEPARLDDVAGLSLDPSDAKTLEKCKPFDCDVKLPAGEMETFRRELDRSHNPAPRADSIMRAWVVDYVNAYRADSSADLVVYDDTKHSVRAGDAFRALLSEPMPAGIEDQPFGSMLAVPRSGRPAGMTSRISWELNRLPGLKPTLEVMERSTLSTAAHPDETFMTTKQLYASHYFEAQVDYITAADGDTAPGKASMYLVILRRQKFDDLPSGGLFNIRGRAVKRLRDALRATLANTRTEVDKAYADAGSAPEHTP